MKEEAKGQSRSAKGSMKGRPASKSHLRIQSYFSHTLSQNVSFTVLGRPFGKANSANFCFYRETNLLNGEQIQ